MTAYFDNSATTKPLPQAVEAVARAMTETWGNPSSLHAAGDAANEQLEAARRTVAAAFGCRPQEVYFTSGGTESNNIKTVNSLVLICFQKVSTELETEVSPFKAVVLVFSLFELIYKSSAGT